MTLFLIPTIFRHSISLCSSLKEVDSFDDASPIISRFRTTASKLSTSFRDEHKDIEWRKIVGMRNRVIHAYDVVDHDIVWDVVQHDLPDLRKKLKKLAT